MRYIPQVLSVGIARSLLLSAIGFCAAVPLQANATEEGGKVVLTGVYRCGSGGGMTHSIDFAASDLGTLRIEQTHNNLDPGDCDPRSSDAHTLAEKLGCSAGPLATPPGGYRMFGFVCQGSKASITDTIGTLSKEIIRPTAP